VVEADTGLEAVRAAIEHRPDLVLMDYQLPDIDGVEAFRRIRAEAALPRMPVVAVTASAMPQDALRMLAAGFDGFETKPISVTALLATVAHFLPPKGVA
jgi:two-component system, cell cycle response regulator DivK